MSGQQEYDWGAQRHTSFTFLSSCPENLESLGSISSVLSSAVVSILGLENGSESKSVVSESNPKSINQTSNQNLDTNLNIRQDQNSIHMVLNAESKPVDFDWLLEICDHDDELVLDVLRSFCEQGQAHISALNLIYSSVVELDSEADRLSFHAVSSIFYAFVVFKHDYAATHRH
jgi:hypothetical protein